MKKPLKASRPLSPERTSIQSNQEPISVGLPLRQMFFFVKPSLNFLLYKISVVVKSLQNQLTTIHSKTLNVWMFDV